MNLIEERWIPIRRQSGEHSSIAPWELTDGIGTDPIVALDVPRRDFEGSLMQCLIGLLQTVFAPNSELVWADRYSEPPSPNDLRGTFSSISRAFELDGDGPRFLQDLELNCADLSPTLISALLIDSPGENTLRLNADHFVKRGRIEALGLPAAAMALLTLQTNAPSGGAGHRTSLRGGGPLTTLVIPDSVSDSDHSSLWHALWLNVLPVPEIEKLIFDPVRADEPDITPWLAPTRTSEKGQPETTPSDAHPLQMYWGMPRRIRLNFEGMKLGRCDITGTQGPVITDYFTRPRGVYYTGPWRHPLSPYYFDKDGTPLPIHPQPGGIAYRHWRGLVLGESERSTPAQVVQFTSYSDQRPRRTRLWAFGYDTDNMKARCWYESTMPLYRLKDLDAEVFSDVVRDLIDAADQIARNLRQAIRSAWFGKGATARGSIEFIENAFWDNTEAAFYRALDAAFEAVDADDETAQIRLRQQWFRTINGQSLSLFDTWAAGAAFEYEDPKRVALARRDLIRFNHKRTIKEALRLGVEIAA